jgi:hypothetical protein
MTMTPPSQLAESSSKLEVRFGTTQPQRRVTVLFRVILVVPQLIVFGFVGVGAYFVGVVGWFAALFTGRLPESIAKFLLGYVRWSTRLNAYLFLMVDTYPSFSLDPDPSYPVDVTIVTGRLNRAAVFFRIILVLPASILVSVLSYGMIFLGFITWIVTLVAGKMPDSFFGASAAAIRYQARTQAYLVMLTSYYPSALFGDKDAFGNKIESPVSGTVLAAPTLPVPYGAYGQAPAWGATPQSVYSPLLPPPPPAGSFPPPPPLAQPTQDQPSATPWPDGHATIPESFGVPVGPPIGVPPAPPIDGAPTGLPPFADPEPPYPGAVPPPPAYQGALPPPPPPPYPNYAAGPPMGQPVSIWPLLLSKGARALTVVFIVVGALFYGTVQVITQVSVHVNFNSIETIVARDGTQSAYQSLTSATNTFKAQTQACTTQSSPSDVQLRCLEQADTAWASSIQAYSTALSILIYPSSAQSAADAAQAAAGQAATTVTSLANSPDAQSYSTASQSQAFQSTLNNVDTTYTVLNRELGG